MTLAAGGFIAPSVFGQGLGRAGTIGGTVTDPTGAVVTGATVEIENKVTGYDRTYKTDETGAFRALDVPPNSYHITVTAPGFQPSVRDVPVQTSVPINLAVKLELELRPRRCRRIQRRATCWNPCRWCMWMWIRRSLKAADGVGGVGECGGATPRRALAGRFQWLHSSAGRPWADAVCIRQPADYGSAEQTVSSSMPENAIASVEVITPARRLPSTATKPVW